MRKTELQNKKFAKHMLLSRLALFDSIIQLSEGVFYKTDVYNLTRTVSGVKKSFLLQCCT